jgi:tetratricopeptide (TPR) repeat protein
MQVFLLLLDAGGKVVTRDELFEAGWGGAIVGDDSLNRAINRVRRIAAETGPKLFEIETVPRTGYRLIGDLNSSDLTYKQQARSSGLRRRTLVGGAIAALGAAGAGYLFLGSRNDRQFAELMSRGERALDTSDPADNAIQFLRPAVELRPDSAKAQGLYAYAAAVRADNGDSNKIGATLQVADEAARAALALEPHQPDARLAQVLIDSSRLDLADTEDRLRNILMADPTNTRVLKHLWNMLQCVGRSREALALVDRALSIKPLAPGHHYPKAQLLWITGKTAEADRVIDRALAYWPSHRFVRFARFTIFAFTGRTSAALAMLRGRETVPQSFSPATISLYRRALLAMDERSPAKIAEACKANLEAARADLKLASPAILTSSALGQVDAAFELANLLFVVPAGHADQSNSPASSTAWRFAPWLFIPPTAPMREDPRFHSLCETIGLTAYWEKRGITPDFELGRV